MALFDREGRVWPEPKTGKVVLHMAFTLDTADPGYAAVVHIDDGTTGESMEWSGHALAYTLGGWAQAMALVAWQLERAQHYLNTFD